jgi:transglutaminase-like putative cysteine protease
MKLKIHHVTTYHYRHAVTLEPHRLLLVPRGSHDLRVLTSSIDCFPHAQLEWSQDVIGNMIATASFPEPSMELRISADSLVEHSAPEWPIFRIAPGAHSYPFVYSDEEATDLGALLHPQAPDSGDKLANWARAFVYGSSTDTLSLLKDINAGISGSVVYRTRDEEGTQSPLETLALGSGSCRDIAALFIDAVRHLGFGARAVSGYLYDPNVSATDEGSTHAWAEVYLPSAGWITFDPTHRRVGSAYLIPVAVARCNAQIMPVTGSYLGSPKDFVTIDVRVSVRQIQEKAHDRSNR